MTAAAFIVALLVALVVASPGILFAIVILFLPGKDDGECDE